jgi:hypothetical protein
VNIKNKPSLRRQKATKEVALFVGFLFFGLVLLPPLIFYVGQTVFGTYGGAGYSDFFGDISAKIRQGNWVTWFLILSPYLGWQFLRLMLASWRLISRAK